MDIASLLRESEGRKCTSDATTNSDSSPHKRREPRKIMFNGEQLNKLEAQYRENKYPSKETRCELALEFNIREYKIKVWFQNRRMKEKRERLMSLQSLDSISRQLYGYNQSKHDVRASPVSSAVLSLAYLGMPTPPNTTMLPSRTSGTCCAPVFSPDILRHDRLSTPSPYPSNGLLPASPAVFSSPNNINGLQPYYTGHSANTELHSPFSASVSLSPQVYQGLHFPLQPTFYSSAVRSEPPIPLYL